MRTIPRITLAATAAAVLIVATPLAASAHVTLDQPAVEAGDYTVITVKVPNESATASTNSVELQLPAETPFSSVRYVPVPGWTVEMTTEQLPEPVTVGEHEITEAVTSIVWTAAPGSEIADGQLQQFDLSLGPVPDVESIMMPAVQTYTDGDVVEWIEEGEDSERPAPVLEVGSAGSDEEADATALAVDSASSTTAAGSPDVVARVIGIGALVLGAVAVVLLLVRRPAAKG